MHGAAHVRSGRFHPVIMIRNKLCYFSNRIIIKFQTFHHCFCNLLAGDRMPFEMVSSIFICGLHYWFSHIMEQHGQSEDFIILYILQRMNCVCSYIIFMMRRILLHTDHVIPFRKHHFCDSQLTGILNPLRMIGYQQFYQLCLNPLCTDLFQIRRQTFDRFCGLRLDWKCQLRRKTYCAQNPKCIL